MPRGRKRPARSRKRVEPDTSCRESARPTKKRRPPPPSRLTTEHRRRSIRESASSRSSSSDWSSSRERRESKRRREIAERARARPSTTETPRRKTKAGKTKNKRRESKKPTGTAEPSGETPENEATLPLPENSSDFISASDLPATKSADPEPSDEPGPSSDSPEEDPLQSTVPCCIPRCPWWGPDDALPDHVEGEHAGMVLSGPVQLLQVPVTDPERGAALSRVVRAFGELFAVHFRRPPKGTTVLGCVQLLGPQERANDFIYQMEVRDENGEMIDPLLQHSPLVANMSSSREFEIAETLKEVCVAEQAAADPDKEPTWGNREVIIIEVEISETSDYYGPDQGASRTSPPPELTFMWM